ncbi:MAG: exopolysaccharide biosynthesis protein, partial [Gammaproteobacteria bacterium]|nr:exopolysaccharide biosynthesis protein [Gammaproteobacteria bacterium]
MIAELKNQLARYEQAIAAPAAAPVDDDFIDLREIWNLLWRRRWTIFITAGVLLVATIIATAMMTPIFRATTVLQIERDAGKVVEYQGVTSEESSGSRDFYQTQYELLQSRTLARRVIDQLGLHESDAMTPDDAEPSFIAGLIGSVKGLFSAPLEAPQDALPRDLEAVFLDNLSVAPISNSRLVRLYYESPDPAEAALVANAIAASFVDMSLERRFEASAYAKGFLEERLKQVRADLEDSERAMVAYTQERGIINRDDKLGILTEKLKEMNRAQVQVESQRFAAESQYQGMLNASMASLAEMLESEVIQNLKQQRADLTSEYQENRKIYKP